MFKDVPSVYVKIAIENGPFSSWIYPLKIVIFYSFLYLYQRVNCLRPSNTAMNNGGFSSHTSGRFIGLRSQVARPVYGSIA